jgi:excisionase family DNA binding protein
LTPSEVARRLGTSTRTVQRWIISGRLPARRIGGRWRVASDAFDAFSASADPPDPASAPVGAPIRRVFIANRGEIAYRITRTCDRLGIVAIVPRTDGPDALDLLDVDAVVDAARAAEADAVHPGFGFLAEHAPFAEAVIRLGMRWVGPPPDAIRAMGDKAAARRLATELTIPVPAGYDGDDQTDDALTAAAARIGLPLLIKPAAGGGGKGMRTVRAMEHLVGELAAARREASIAFGDVRLILERLVEGGRHVEVQVLFDEAGHGVHLGERDCSVQRRHQKVLEEAPAPDLPNSIRDGLTTAAIRLASAVGYVGAGTCEFLVDDRGEWTFLEMNTRLQVEHPVTELVTGRDLVADQLRIAAGAALGFGQDEVGFSGHAIEVRLYAEDAEAGFLPATGTIERLRWPVGAGIRVDAGVAEGDVIGGRFDPMLAKIVAHGTDRADALARLTRALDETVVLGLVTNLRFLRWLVREPMVRDARVRTDSLDRVWLPDDWAERTRIPDEAWALAAVAVLPAIESGLGPWSGGFRLNAPPAIRLRADDEIRTTSPAGSTARTPFEYVRVGDGVHVDLGGRSTPFRLAPPPDVDRAASAAAAQRSGRTVLVAPMPGRVLSLGATVGSPVEAGAAVVTLEAMKMEHAVTAPHAGRVAELAVALGEQVQRGQALATIDAG